MNKLAVCCFIVTLSLFSSLSFAQQTTLVRGEQKTQSANEEDWANASEWEDEASIEASDEVWDVDFWEDLESDIEESGLFEEDDVASGEEAIAEFEEEIEKDLKDHFLVAEDKDLEEDILAISKDPLEDAVEEKETEETWDDLYEVERVTDWETEIDSDPFENELFANNLLLEFEDDFEDTLWDEDEEYFQD